MFRGMSHSAAGEMDGNEEQSASELMQTDQQVVSPHFNGSSPLEEAKDSAKMDKVEDAYPEQVIVVDSIKQS